MHNSEQIAFLSRIWRKLKVFLFTRDAFIFLFFLIISAIFWLIISLNKPYETHISIPISYINTPHSIELTADLPSFIAVKVKDKGTTLLGYSRLRFQPLVVDFNDYTSKNNVNQWNLPTASMFDKEVKEMLDPTTQVLDFYPQYIEISNRPLSSKRVPVVADTQLSYAKQYYPNDSIRVQPDTITLYGNPELLDTTHVIKTNLVTAKGLKDTLRAIATLALPLRSKAKPETVTVTAPVEFFTEGKQSVPVKVINVPKNLHVRTLPAEVEVSYLAGFSRFKNIIPADFTVTIDYNDLISSSSTTATVHIEQAPEYVIKPKVRPETVTWIIEVIK